MSMVGMLTSILEHIKQDENRNTLMRQEIASTRASVIILAALPAVGILLSLILGANSLIWLASTSMGRVCGMVGIALEGIGVYWLSKMVKRATSR
jgi:tight adherence protein B